MTALPLILALSFLPYFEGRNQVANFVLNPPPEGAEPVKSDKPDLITVSQCPACEGKGEIVLEEPNYGQADGRLGKAKKTKKKCPVCKGVGKTEAYVDPADLTVQVARDREKFASDHQGRGEIAVGQAFVPNAAYDEANSDKDKKKKLKLVEEAYGKPCTKCHWTGVEACKKCDGRGLIECPEDDCKGGFLVSKITTEKSYSHSGGGTGYGGRGGFRSGGSRRTTKKETKVNVQICPTCGGAKMTVCPECGGRKARPCKSCNGLGIKQKTR